MNINKIIGKVKRKYGVTIDVKVNEQSIILTGVMDKWIDIVKVGYMFTSSKRHVVNEIRLDNENEKQIRSIKPITKEYDQQTVDVLIIGGGIIGASILRELSKYQLKILLIDKEADLAMGASGANDGMIHPGIDLKKGSLKAKYCLQGNKMYEQLAKELDFEYQKCGQYIVFSNHHEKVLANYARYKAYKLHIPGVKIISKKEIHQKEPSTYPWAKGAIYLKNTGIVSPYKTTIAFAENAIINHANIALETACLGMNLYENKIIEVLTNRGTIYPRIVINASGVYADEIAKMANDKFFSIHPRRGTDIILDRKFKNNINTIISKFPKILKRSHTKGGAIISTVDGNVLIGPDAEEISDREANNTTKEAIDRVFQKHHQVLPIIQKSDIIAYFSGIRAATYEEDFIVEASKKVSNLIHVAGIQSPGFTAAPAIALDVTKMAISILNKEMIVNLKTDYNPYRHGPFNLSKMSNEDRERLIHENPDYGKIICRCEEISLGEIKDAIPAIIPATSIDAIKRRVRAGMGRCQGSFCMPLLLKTLSKELNNDILDILKRGYGTNYGLFKTKDVRYGDEEINHDL